MTKVLLVRHGQASAGTDNYDRLSDTGKEQSRLLGEFWRNSGAHFDAAFSGSLERQQHTAKIALASLENSPSVQVLEGLNEYEHDTVDRLYGHGIDTTVGMDLSFDQYVEIMSVWRDAPHTPEMQSWQAFSQLGWNTVNKAVDAHKEKDSLVFFTSGGVISTILMQLMSSSFDVAMRSLWQTRNSGMTQLLYDKSGVSLVDYNTVPHLLTSTKRNLITQI